MNDPNTPPDQKLNACKSCGVVLRNQNRFDQSRTCIDCFNYLWDQTEPAKDDDDVDAESMEWLQTIVG